MKKTFLLCLFGLIMLSALSGLPKKSQTKTSAKLVLTGYVAAKGNMPFIYPAIHCEDGTEYFIVCKDKVKQKLLNAQGYLIKFTGSLDTNGAFVLKKWKKVK